jgi:transmembrane sensor
MSEERIRLLLQLYLNRSASDTETRELFFLLEQAEDSQSVREQVAAFWAAYDVEKEPLHSDMADFYDSIIAKTPVGRSKKTNWLPWIAVAASLILVVFGVRFFVQQSAKQNIKVKIQATKTDIAPGGDKAVLTLGNGSKIVLDSIHNGLLAMQSGSSVSKTGNGVVAYHEDKTAQPDQISYNTLSTPRGGQFQLVLSDGTRVWLNAASSIIYPTAFAGRERRVTITGEAYFEVVHNDKSPFMVSVNGLTIEDVGTHFNIKAYQDETETTTTLLEGAVRIDGRTIRAGEKAVADKSGSIQVSEGNPEQAVAWKNGFFYFADADLETVMRELSRWYDFEVKYESKIPERQFDGMIGRSLTLGQVLKGLSKERVNYSIERGNQLIIKP